MAAFNESSPSHNSVETSQSSNSTTTQQTLNILSNGTHLKQKRARSQLSCIPCRQGKLKCNRSHDPACDQCLKRNREGACNYMPPPQKQRPAQNVKGRIRQLESLVVDLMNQQTNKDATPPTGEQSRNTALPRQQSSDASTLSFDQRTPPSDHDASPSSRSDLQDAVDSATKPFGQMRISKNEICYVGDTHWQAILNGISDLKRDLADDDEEEEQNEDEAEGTRQWGNVFGVIPLDPTSSDSMGSNAAAATNGLGFMLGGPANVTREQLVNSVPEKKVADRLLSLWFNSPDPFKPIIHAPNFQEEYRKFWRDPKDTPTMWLGLLFAILSLAASFGLRDNDPNSESARRILAQVNSYHTLSASAAVLADFTKPKPYTIECLILYTAGLRSNDAFVNVWLMVGLILRLCLRMGYHRDSSKYPGISAFDGEMRRRVWGVINMIDVLISFQLGLPSMVKTLQSDTEPPRNLLDRDFNVNTKVLPPGRGIDELTPSSYTRAKLRIIRVFANVSEISHATIPPMHDEMMLLDAQLEEAKAAIPPLLQMPDISELVTDPAEQVMCRFNLDLLFLKTKIVLHRRYMEKPFAQLDPREQVMGIGYSRKACVDCALRVLQHHHTIYNASQPGGQLESVKWYMGSISTHDFLLAAMVVCLELSQQISNTGIMNPSGRRCPKQPALMDALEKSQQIWSDASGRNRKRNQFTGSDENTRGEHMFDETEKASRAMKVMLDKVKAKFPAEAKALDHINGQPHRPEIGLADDDFEIVNGGPADTTTSAHGAVPFGGIVSYHNWGETRPESVQFTGPPHTGGHGMVSINGVGGSPPGQATPQMESNGTSPEDGGSYPDFSMIGNMIDMPGTLDWDMFDAGLIKNKSIAQPQLGDAYGGPIPGNAIMSGGTGAGSGLVGEAPQSYGGGWHDFSMDIDSIALDNWSSMEDYSKMYSWPGVDAQNGY